MMAPPKDKRAMCFDALCKDLTDGGKRLETLREITIQGGRVAQEAPASNQ